MTDPCPCGRGRPFDDCCGPIIAGAPAVSAEALMRARYVAFLRCELDFLESSLAAEKRAEFDRVEVEASAREAEGRGFEVLATTEDGDQASVDYIARFRVRGQDHPHFERARFRREDGRWLYVDGEVSPRPPQRHADKVGRNDPCPCGSGRKYKKCCGA
ncbi:MAG: YchJ family protein [Actinomycetota bacterium]